MKEEKLFDGITYIDDDLVEEAVFPPKATLGSFLLAFGKVAAVFALFFGAVMGGFYALLSYALGGGAQGEAERYFGAAFPLTAITEPAGLQAERDLGIYLDWTGTDKIRSFRTHLNDTYRLTNTTGAQIKLELAYPFSGSLHSRDADLPQITVDAQPTETELVYGGKLYATNEEADSWEDFRPFFAQGYRAAEIGYEKLAQIPLTVYEVTDLQSTAGQDVRLMVSFDADPTRTTVWTARSCANSWDREPGTYFAAFEIFRDPDISGQIIVFGDDIENLRTQGYSTEDTIELLPGNEVEGVTADIRRYETTLLELLLAEQDPDLGQGPFRDILLSAISDAMEFRNWDFGSLGMDGSLIGLSNLACRGTHVLYQKFTVTIPAGSSVEVAVTHTPDRLPEFPTTLGSNLTFTRLTAELDWSGGDDWFRIGEQNFGFDRTGGITAVTLDPAEECYYLRIEEP